MRRLATIFLVLFLTLPVMGQDEERVLPYDALLRSAKIYLGQTRKDYDAAQEMLQTAIDNYENPVEAYYLLGLIYSEKANHVAMMESFAKFREICAWAEENNDKDLKKTCKKEEMPKMIENVIVSEWESSFQDGLTRLQAADSLAGEVESLTDDSAKAAMQESVDKLLARSKEEFEVCVLVDSSRYQAISNLAIVESRLGNSDTAVELYERAYEIKPNDADILSGLSSMLYELGRFEEAVGYFEKMAEVDTLNATWAYTYAAICYQKLNQRDKMRGVFDRVLEINPDDAQIHYQRGIYFVQEAASIELRDSMRVIDSLLSASPNNKSLKAAKEDLTDYRVGFYNKALPDFARAVELDSTMVDYRYWYATAALFSDDIELARKVYEGCVELDPDFSDCWCGLETVYARLNLPEKFEEAQAKCED